MKNRKHTKRIAMLSAALALCWAGAAQAKDIVIHAGTLIDGISNAEKHNVSIVIHDDRIVSVDDGFVTPEGAEVIDLSKKTVLPGLIDTHVHLTLQLGKYPQLLGPVTRSAFDGAMEGVANARTTLLAGFTSVRDVGGYTPAVVALKRAQKEGTIEGPRMWVSGNIVGPTGGHGDLSTGYDPALSKPEWSAGIVDGADEALKKVREMHRDGVDLIKIVPSGGVASVGDDPQAQLMTDAEIKTIVDTAHVLHMKVAAHSHGTQATDHASELGVDSIEHGTFATPETYKIMKAHGTYLVPTLIAGETVYRFAKTHPELLSPSVAQKALAVAPRMNRNAYDAWKAGVKIAFGTDAGVYQHGLNGQEFALMVKAGIPAMDTIKAATTSAADLIGDSADIGSIQPGRYADIVATDGDPLGDIAQLQNIGFVMQGGRVYKQDGHVIP
ncbi:metal-dependent hydrolase family protein [Novosphingobium beihaiensis]|uniref:Amidohydrolase family protein n=1 Tax=Novosphingobium beihaiensis TaxID=2930389 RepID=A0ABT0BUG4_9SPHN|nr:amidohydrolase family protein [Novosphingobium beihaiensis]MCJ2188679.1 amidohydrolase family protein [Novosphingobium beihaiensis]